MNVGFLNGYRAEYAQNRFVFIPGREMRPVLAALGADLGELAALQEMWDSLPDDPTLKFRKSRNGRFLIDPSDQSVTRLEQRDFMLSEGEDFKRHDSGKVRHFEPIPGTLQANSIFQALYRFKALMIDGIDFMPRKGLQHDRAEMVSTAFTLRTISYNDLIGEPAAEGVHSDGVEHTMTTLIGAVNMTEGSAISSIHFNEETTGIHTSKTKPEHLAARVRHADPLDTLLIVDTERKHSLTRVEQRDLTARTTRDMLILFTRRPCAPSHPSFEIDDLAHCEARPMRITY